MYEKYQLTGGTMVGRYHLGDHKVLVGKNNQDAYQYLVKDDYMIGVVSDGCGSTPYAEFGSRFLTNLITKELHRLLPEKGRFSMVMDALWHSTLYYMQSVAMTVFEGHRASSRFRENLMEILDGNFLATIVGFVILPEQTHIFHIGDGFYFINEEPHEIKTLHLNRPPYIAYNLYDESTQVYFGKENLKFKVETFNTADIKSLMIATDGLKHFIESEDNKIPGLKEKVGPVSQFWTDDNYFSWSGNVDLKLSTLNREYMKYDKKEDKVKIEKGLLRDDTTLIAVREHSTIYSDDTAEE